MKTLMTTVMKTKAVAALLSWFSRHCFSTSLRFSRAVEKGEWQVSVCGGGGGGRWPQPGASPTTAARVQRKSGPSEIKGGGSHRAEMLSPQLTSVGSPRGTNRARICRIVLGLLRVGMHARTRGSKERCYELVSKSFSRYYGVATRRDTRRWDRVPACTVWLLLGHLKVHRSNSSLC